MEKIKQFLNITTAHKYGDGDGYGDGYVDGNGYGYGYGDGNGNGNGYGDGYGDGYRDGNGNGYGDGYGDGNGNGNGYGDGNGNGSGYGDGDGNGLKSLNNQPVYLIDKVQTIITSVKNNIAKGFIVQSDLTLTRCYIVKGENQFAHGKTAKEAIKQLQNKLIQTLSTEERIVKFKEYFSSSIKKYKAIEFYNWHTTLTGSCDLGKKAFIADKNIDLDKDKFTVKEFINIVKDNYGSDVIKLLAKECNLM